jgi:hypothetical protein
MFVCDFCSKPIGPKVKPLMVTFQADARSMTYTNQVPHPDNVDDYNFTNRTPKTITKISVGYEFEKEFKSCAECQGVEVKAQPKGEDKAWISVVKGMQAYARKSNKKIDEDKVMQVNLERFKDVPLGIVSQGLEDPKVASPKWSLAHTIVGNLIERVKDKSKRASADFNAAFATMKAYESRGGSL